jgi:two-component system, OmpR family, phosphate regulon response regulator PhoB
MKILCLEDDPGQLELVLTILRAEGHDVVQFHEGSQVIRYLESSTAELLVLDWEVPNISGLDVLGWVRERVGRELPVLFLTNRMREEEIVAALNAGADDYMTKPVLPRALIARVNALLRRAYLHERSERTRIEEGNYVIDLHNRTVSVDGQPIDLTPREFDLTALLFRNIGRVMPREMLIKHIWGRDLQGVSRSLDTHVYRLRKKLAIRPVNGVRLRAVYTHGYRLESVNITDLTRVSDRQCHISIGLVPLPAVVFKASSRRDFVFPYAWQYSAIAPG